MRFSELVQLLEKNGFRLVKEKGSIRYYAKSSVDKLIRVDYHGSKEIPAGTLNAILKAAGLKQDLRKPEQLLTNTRVAERMGVY